MARLNRYLISGDTIIKILFVVFILTPLVVAMAYFSIGVIKDVAYYKEERNSGDRIFNKCMLTAEGDIMSKQLYCVQKAYPCHLTEEGASCTYTFTYKIKVKEE